MKITTKAQAKSRMNEILKNPYEYNMTMMKNDLMGSSFEKELFTTEEEYKTWLLETGQMTSEEINDCPTWEMWHYQTFLTWGYMVYEATDFDVFRQ
jgi:hypothetical protein